VRCRVNFAGKDWVFTKWKGVVVVSIVIVDDHRIVAEGLARLVQDDPEIRVAGLLGSGEDLLTWLRRADPPDVCVLDLSMPGMNGADLLATLRSQYPSVRVLIVSAAARPEIAARCLREGANGFLSKFRSSESFLEALHAVAAGESYVDRGLFTEVLEFLASHPTGENTVGDLSSREFAVMQRLAEGMSVKEIAATLNLSAKTISTYRARLMKKMNFRSNADLVAYCINRGLIQAIET